MRPQSVFDSEKNLGVVLWWVHTPCDYQKKPAWDEFLSEICVILRTSTVRDIGPVRVFLHGHVVVLLIGRVEIVVQCDAARLPHPNRTRRGPGIRKRVRTNGPRENVPFRPFLHKRAA